MFKKYIVSANKCPNWSLKYVHSAFTYVSCDNNISITSRSFNSTLLSLFNFCKEQQREKSFQIIETLGGGGGKLYCTYVRVEWFSTFVIFEIGHIVVDQTYF